MSGNISKINSELGYGFIQIPKVGEVFFSKETKFDGTHFEGLKVNDPVRVSVTETDRGPFASMLSLSPKKIPTRAPDLSV